MAEQLAWARRVLLALSANQPVQQQAVDVVFTLVDRLEAMLLHTSDMITVLAGDGTIRYSNAAAGALTGFNEEVNGSDALGFIHPDDREEAVTALASCLDSDGAEAQAAVRLRFADGSWHEVEATARNCLNTPVAGIVVSMRDVTERNAAARLERAAHESMRDFVALASHELRTPTTVIKGFADILARRWDDLAEPERRRYTAEVAGAATRLSALIDDLIMLSVVEGGADRSPHTAVNVAEIAGRVAARFPDVGVDVEPGLAVLANADQVERMLHNYVANATRYGRPPVAIGAKAESVASERWVRIAVIDHGPGVADSFVPELFGRFSRPDKSASRLTGGAGLGLCIVRALASANGGTAWYEPNQPHGARFLLRLCPAD